MQARLRNTTLGHFPQRSLCLAGMNCLHPNVPRVLCGDSPLQKPHLMVGHSLFCHSSMSGLMRALEHSPLDEGWKLFNLCMPFPLGTTLQHQQLLNKRLLNLIEMLFLYRAHPMVQWVKTLPAMQETQETQVWPLGWEDPLERKWQPTPVFLPGKSYGQSSLAGYKSTGHKESDTTERVFKYSIKNTNSARMFSEFPAETETTIGPR